MRRPRPDMSCKRHWMDGWILKTLFCCATRYTTIATVEALAVRLVLVPWEARVQFEGNPYVIVVDKVALSQVLLRIGLLGLPRPVVILPVLGILVFVVGALYSGLIRERSTIEVSAAHS
jgi:hypothetical protein